MNNIDTFDNEFWQTYLNNPTNNLIDDCIDHEGQKEQQLQKVHQDLPLLNSDRTLLHYGFNYFSKD